MKIEIVFVPVPMNINASYPFPAKNWLIVLSALAITILFAIPRLAVFRFSQVNLPIEYSLPDFMVRSLYSFTVALLFFKVNFSGIRFRLGHLTIDMHKLSQAIVVNLCLLLVIDVGLLRLHLYLFEPTVNERLFRILFHCSLTLEVILVVLLSYIYRLLFYNQKIQVANERLLKSNAETRYEVLKSQVNPHFLFNSFNTINSLILHNPEAALQFVGNLSDVFRYVLTRQKTDLVRLEEEIHFIEAYAAMLKGRYGNKISFCMDVHPEHMRLRLPPMALQILVENAVKHNVASVRSPLHIHLFTGDDHILTLSNTLQLKKIAEPSTGLGLSNLNQRCKYLSNQEIEIRRTAHQFSVSLLLIP